MADSLLTSRPATTVAVGGWSIVGAASVNAALADESNSTYVDANGAVGVAKVGMADLALGDFDLLRYLRPWVRASSPSGARRVGVRMSGGPNQEQTPEQVLTLSNTITRYDLLAYVGWPSGRAFTVDDLADLFLAFREDTNPPGALRVYAAGIDAVYNAAPTAVIESPPVIVTDNAAVGIVFSYSDPEDDPQDRYEARIYEQPAAGWPAGGVAEADIAAFDASDIQPVMATERLTDLAETQTAVLAPFGEHRAYLRVGDRGGFGRYGSWQFQQFQMEMDEPLTAPVLAVDPEPALARVRVEITPADTPVDYFDLHRSDDGGSTWRRILGARPNVPFVTTSPNRLNATGFTEDADGDGVVDGWTLYSTPSGDPAPTGTLNTGSGSTPMQQVSWTTNTGEKGVTTRPRVAADGSNVWEASSEWMLTFEYAVDFADVSMTPTVVLDDPGFTVTWIEQPVPNNALQRYVALITAPNDDTPSDLTIACEGGDDNLFLLYHPQLASGAVGAGGGGIGASGYGSEQYGGGVVGAGEGSADVPLWQARESVPLVFYDRTAPREATVLYRARTVANVGPGAEWTSMKSSSSWTASEPALLAADGNSWLHSATDGGLDMAVLHGGTTVAGSTHEDQGVYWAEGRPSPIVAAGTVHLQTFDGVRLVFTDDDAYERFVVLRDMQEPLLMQTLYGEGPLEQWWLRVGAELPVERVGGYGNMMVRGQLRVAVFAAYEVEEPTSLAARTSAVFAGPTGGGGGGGGGGDGGQPPPVTGVTLLWADEFNSAASVGVDPSKWFDTDGFQSFDYDTLVSDLDGLALYAKLDEPSGTTANDSSENLRDGTLSGSGVTYGDIDEVVLTVGVAAEAMTFTTGTATFAHHTDFNLDTDAADEWTVIIDAKSLAAAGTFPYLLKKGDEASGGFAIFYDEDLGSLGYKVDGTQYADTFDLAAAHHVAVVWDGTNLTFYADGYQTHQFTPANITIDSNTSALQVGGGSTLTLARLVVARSAATAAQIEALFAALTTTGGEAGELQVYRPGTANMAHDGAGNLAITAKLQTVTVDGVSYDYTSGRIEGKFAFTTGYIECRAKFTTWPGSAPVFKITGADHAFPWSGDARYQVRTGTSEDPTVLRQVLHGHWPGHTESDPDNMWQLGWTTDQVDMTPERPGDAFHKYGIHVKDDGQTDFYVDELLTASWVDGDQDVDGEWTMGTAPQVPVLQVAMGSYSGAPAGSPTSQAMLVDYVRIYDDLPFEPAEPPPPPPPPPPGGEANLVWSDEFTGAANTVPDSASWVQEAGPPVNLGRIEYDTPGNHNAKQDGSTNLVIEVRREAYGGRSYTAARFKCLEGLLTGYIECRAKFGTWSGWAWCFWLDGLAGYSTAHEAEIDYEVASMSDPNRARLTVHGRYNNNPSTPWQLGWTANEHDFSPNKPGSAFRQWGFYFDDTKVEFYIDRVLVRTYTKAQVLAQWGSIAEWPYGTYEMRAVLEVECPAYAYSPNGQPDNTTNADQFIVDYVRYYDALPF